MGQAQMYTTFFWLIEGVPSTVNTDIIWFFNIAMKNPNHKWRFLAGKIIYKWAISHGYVK